MAARKENNFQVSATGGAGTNGQPARFAATGGALGPNAGEEVMAAPAMLKAQNNQDIAQLAAYLPFYAKVAESPRASNATRNWYRYIRSQVEGAE